MSRKRDQPQDFRTLAAAMTERDDMFTRAPSCRLDRPRAKEHRIERAWHAVRTEPLCEAKLAARLIGDWETNRLKIGHYLPTTKVSFQRMGRMVIATRALFPGIFFIYFPDEEAEAKGFDKLRGWPGFLNMLRSGNPRTGTWAEIEASGIRALQVQEAEASLSTAKKKLKIPYARGDTVQVTGNNPFAGFRARIEEVEPSGRIAILLDVFGRKTPTKVDPGEVIKV